MAITSTRLDLRFRIHNEEMFNIYPPIKLFFNRNPLIKYIERKRAATVATLSNIHQNSLKLDLGCGDGFITKDLSGTVIGLDLSRKALQLAKTLFCKEYRFDFILGEASSLPFRDGVFGVVVCSEVLEHVPFPERVLSEMIRVMKNQSSLIITLPKERNIKIVKRILKALGLSKILLKGIPNEEIIDDWHISHIEVTWLIRKLEKNGLRLKTRSYIPWFYPIRSILVFSKIGNNLEIKS